MNRTVGELRSGARAVLDEVELTQVFVTECDFRCMPGRWDPPFNIDMNLSVSGTIDGSGRKVYAWSRYWLNTRNEGGIADVWTASVMIGAAFDKVGTGDAVFSEDQLTAFATIVGAPTSHPYARSALQEMTARSPYPALTIGLLTPIGGLPDDQEIPMEWTSMGSDYPSGDVAQ